VTDGTRDLAMVSKKGRAIRFAETDARAMGRTAAGVNGMRLRGPDDEVLAMAPLPPKSHEEHERDFLLVVTENGFGKRSAIQEYPQQKRGGQGVKTVELTERRGGLVGALVVPYEAEVLLVTGSGTLIRMSLADVHPKGRATQGVSLMKPGEGAGVVGLALVVEDAIDDEDAELPAPVGSEASASAAASPASTADGETEVDTDPDLAD
jgi:DNA gyrase subunit A